MADAWVVVLVDGHFCAELSCLESLPQGVELNSLSDVLRMNPDSVKAYLGTALQGSEHGFIALNNAGFSDGIVLRVPAKQVLDKPIQCLHWSSQANQFVLTRTIIIIEAFAQAQFVETFAGSEASYLTSALTEVFVGENAGLTLYKQQSESEQAYHYGGIYVQQAAYSRFAHHNFAFGALLARTDIACALEQAADCELNGLYLGAKRQHIDNYTRINHAKPYATSREVYKGVLDERARGVFQGRVVVAENAQKTDSAMSNRNLLLSDAAEADTKPQLEIYADDVKCSHGVTVGQLDEQSVFYLKSRGIDESAARNMLTFAFANEMVAKVTLADLHEVVLAELLAKFPQQAINRAWL
ncbi:Fe-S cluster assembly protein SufD [Methylocucumis oryzae]|uniref:Fe-S cluster assembly protein SufD n=1 Tax=Methylocucumis oryzae TaxID=1632867 RepID=UPI000AE1F617